MFDDEWLMMAYLDEDWAGPPKPWVDPRNQAQATEIALKNGLTDLRHEKNILGGSDYREAIRERGDESELCAEEGVTLPWLGGAASTSSGQADSGQAADDDEDPDRRDRQERQDAESRRE